MKQSFNLNSLLRFCKRCGNDFFPSSPKNIICVNCQGLDYREKCKMCGKPFSKNNPLGGTSFCKKCYGKEYWRKYLNTEEYKEYRSEYHKQYYIKTHLKLFMVAHYQNE